MPYSLENPPEKLRGLPEKTQRQWLHVYSSCMAKYGDDIKCQKMSWGVTHGFKEDKGFYADDPDRDILIELECLNKSEDEDIESQIAEQLGLNVEVK